MTSPDAPGARDDLLGRLLGDTGPRADADPHAGHAHAERPSADVSVRPAVPDDAPLLGAIHARTLRATLTAGTGQELGPEVLAALDATSLAASWREAITAPPSPRHRVLTAVAGAQVVGFAAFAPAEVGVELDGDAGPGRDGPPAQEAVAEIVALEVPAQHGRQGHGSRLLAACADLLRQQGTARVQAWAVQGDECRARFLGQAGFAPAGLRRTLDVAGAPVTEICWYADL
ncbi:GNAT family N-acetyltransferase [Georgenia sp. AZ-5]|uniref:GNAT family N-acetyltransferase n=1 Tax=Georgenia sp. AZ-5 TaxID=3367526 RepID=UPI0037553D62